MLLCNATDRDSNFVPSERVYHPEKKYNVPEQRIIGKRSENNPDRMLPNNIWQDREKMISLEEQIKKQEETVLKVKEKYDSEMMKLKDLYAKRAI